MKGFAWTTLIWGLPIVVVLGGVGEWQYARGYDAGFKAAPPPVQETRITLRDQALDEACMAWMFNTNFAQAKKRVCNKK